MPIKKENLVPAAWRRFSSLTVNPSNLFMHLDYFALPQICLQLSLIEPYCISKLSWEKL